MSAVLFVCEVAQVDAETKTTKWTEVVSYPNEQDAMDFVACNCHCLCRYRPQPQPEARP